MRIFFAILLFIFSFVQSINAQNITSAELSKLSADINALQIATDGKTLIDPNKNSSTVISFPKQSFSVLFSSGFAYRAVYKDDGTDQLFVTENIDFSATNKVTVLPVNNKSGVQCIRVSFPEPLVTRILENGKEINTISGNTLDFYYATSDLENKNKLKTSLETLISKLEKDRSKYHTLGKGKLTLPDGQYEGDYIAGNRRTNEGTMEYINEPLYKGVWRYKGQWKNDRRHGEGSIKNVPYKKGDIVGADGGIPDETYSGNWVNDVLQGPGKYETWSWKYEGNFVNGKMEGKGTSTERYNSKYVGDWKNGVKEGFGIWSDESGDYTYTGEWKNNQQDGKGISVSKKYGIRKEGQWKDGRLHGYATYKEDDGDSYEGNWVNGTKEGKGTIIYKDGGKYVGEWKKGDKDGYGIYTEPGGSRYDGNWSKNMKEGKGTQTYQNSEKFVGEWRNNKRSQGLCTWNNGDSYLGEWVNDTLHGKGTMMYANGEKYVGKWSFGRKDGHGILYDKENKILKQENLNMGKVRVDLPDLRTNTSVLNTDENYFVSYKLSDTSFIVYIRYNEKAITSQPKIKIFFDVNGNKKIDNLDIVYTDIFRGSRMFAAFLEESGTKTDVSRITLKRPGGMRLENRIYGYEFSLADISTTKDILFQIIFSEEGNGIKKYYKTLPAGKEEPNFSSNKMYKVKLK
ncbi:MAG: hypothetical protein IPH34_08645 [Chitinophagaceae bacterium]|nr:hypothetical protein [Chitinophagaceae bacterium]MBK8309500.1 hypothetical protein [Chitinophagaceae bacterium]MBP6477095.1 hypothetical protein [Chitinophagaceae bacterium]MBP7109430.1 hypothetical protein [Chitinophagaceae bacterium]MBP7315023.1 hypothetical protein [Chitinophagaceae bacterium]